MLEYCYGWVKLWMCDYIFYYINKIIGERLWEDLLKREGGRGILLVLLEDLCNLLSLKRVGNVFCDVNISIGGEEMLEDL